MVAPLLSNVNYNKMQKDTWNVVILVRQIIFLFLLFVSLCLVYMQGMVVVDCGQFIHVAVYLPFSRWQYFITIRSKFFPPSNPNPLSVRNESQSSFGVNSTT